jgi:hypothetical protein
MIGLAQEVRPMTSRYPVIALVLFFVIGAALGQDTEPADSAEEAEEAEEKGVAKEAAPAQASSDIYAQRQAMLDEIVERLESLPEPPVAGDEG